MTVTSNRRYAALAGPAFVGLVIGVLAMPESPDSKASGAKVIAFLHAHRNAIHVQDFLLAFAALAAIVYFSTVASYLRRRGADILATTTFGGAVLMAAGFCVAAGINEAGVDQPSRLTPAVAQTLNLLSNDTFAVLLFGGLALATTSAGISMLRTKALPKWLGIVTTVVGVGAATGIVSWFAFMATGPLTLIVATYVYRRIDRPGEITMPEVSIPAQPTVQDATNPTTAKA